MSQTQPAERGDRPNVSYALRDLLALERLLTDAGRPGAGAPTAAHRRTGLRLVRRLGGMAVRVLLRELLDGAGASVELAQHLLVKLAAARVTREAARLLRDPAVGDAAKLRLLAVLSEREEPIPDDATLADPAAVLGGAIEQLLASLQRPADFDRAARLLLAQVPDDELVDFCRAGLRQAGPRAAPLIEAMLRCGAMGPAAHAALGHLLETVALPGCLRPREADLERGVALLEERRLAAALRHLRAFVAANPHDVEGQSALGVCLTQAGRPEEAIPRLAFCTVAEPDRALHHWNLAAAAQKAGRLGRCYLALRDFLAHAGDPGESGRCDAARRYVDDYEQAVRASCPGRAPEEHARAEVRPAARRRPARRPPP